MFFLGSSARNSCGHRPYFVDVALVMMITIDLLLFCPLSRTQLVEKARADAEKIKLIGAAEATAIENVGRSEAEAMRLKAAAYKLYGEAATLSLVFEALPKIAAEVAAPLAKTEEIVMLSGGGSLTAGINQLVSQVPPAVHALTGVDLSQVIKKISFHFQFTAVFC